MNKIIIIFIVFILSACNENYHDYKQNILSNDTRTITQNKISPYNNNDYYNYEGINKIVSF